MMNPDQKSPQLRVICLILVTMTLGGCNKYSFSINNNEVYSPPPLYAQFKVADKALDTCLRQTIADQQVRKVEELTGLNCSKAGIESLEGLEQFAWLKKIDFSGNNIRDNAALLKLTRLEYLNVSDNTHLNCADLPASSGSSKLDIIRPKHCQ